MKIFEELERKRAWQPEEQAILDAVRRVADEVIAPNAAGFDKSGEFPWKNVEALNALGLNGIFVPEAYGGNPTRYTLYLAVVKIISEACASTGVIYATTFHGLKPLIDVGTEEQKKRLLPRIAAGGLGSLAGAIGREVEQLRQQMVETDQQIEKLETAVAVARSGEEQAVQALALAQHKLDRTRGIVFQVFLKSLH